MLPDVDVVAAGSGPMGQFLYHRAATHSLWFGPVVGSILGVLLWRRARARGRPGSALDWVGLAVIAIFTHPLLDVCTTYGTQLLAPFSNRRFALDAVAVVDPFYSLVLVAGLLTAAWFSVADARSARAGAAALVLSTGYLAYGHSLNERAESEVRDALAGDAAASLRVDAYPTLLQPWLRRVVARDAGRIRVGWMSLWNGGADRVEWTTFREPDDPRVAALRATPEGRIFEWFAMGQTAGRVEPSAHGTTVEIDDLRYGFPSRPRLGLWAIQGRFDEQGRLAGPVERIERPLPAPASSLIRELFRATFAGARLLRLGGRGLRGRLEQPLEERDEVSRRQDADQA